MRSNHRAAEAIYEVSYDLVGELSDPCAYCGKEATGWDHVPPLHFVARLSEEDRNRANLRKYPACKECNSALTGHILRTLAERRAYIKQYLRRKYRSWIEMPNWDSNDLSELSTDDARRYISSHTKFARGLKARLAWPDETAPVYVEQVSQRQQKQIEETVYSEQLDLFR